MHCFEGYSRNSRVSTDSIFPVSDKHVEKDKDLKEILDEIDRTAVVEQTERILIEMVVREVLAILDEASFLPKALGYKRLLSERDISKEVDLIKKLSKHVAVFCSAVYLSMGYCPWVTQIVACVSLILSGVKKGKLLQIQTGEGSPPL